MIIWIFMCYLSRMCRRCGCYISIYILSQMCSHYEYWIQYKLMLMMLMMMNCVWHIANSIFGMHTTLHAFFGSCADLRPALRFAFSIPRWQSMFVGSNTCFMMIITIINVGKSKKKLIIIIANVHTS